jgi:hypothetical protein
LLLLLRTVPLQAADQFQPSPVFQGPRPGFVYTTGQHGTGYYKDTPPPIAPAAAAPQQAAAPPAAAAAKQRPAAAGSDSRGGSAVSGAAASHARQSPAAAAAAGAAARRAAAAAAAQPKVPRKVELQLPAVKVAAPKPQLVGQGQEVRRKAGVWVVFWCLWLC